MIYFEEDSIEAIIDAIPVLPHGNIDGAVAPRLRALIANPLTTLHELHELNGLVARGIYLARRPPAPSDFFPTSGAPVAMAA